MTRLEDVTWYSPFVHLVGAVLSFADPITDILTLVEFYRADHKIWFGVGLAFVILPCLVFPIMYSIFLRTNENYSCTRRCTQTILCGFHPFSAAFVRLQGFVFCLEKWWRGNEMDSDKKEEANYVLTYIDIAVLFETALESAPQFLIQLYAASVQVEPVEVIQIISLSVSFLSVTWAFTTADEMFLAGRADLTIKHKHFLFITHLFLLSSRLFAICYFTISYKWWVIGVLLFHTFVMLIADNIYILMCGCRRLKQGSPEDKCTSTVAIMCILSVLLSCVNWLREDFSTRALYSVLMNGESPKAMQVFFSVLSVVENFVIILLFYFSEFSNTWYSLPVTVCVCVFSVLGSVMRVTHFHFLLGSKSVKNDTVKPQGSNNV